VIQVTPQLRILVATEPVDFRKGIDGLSQVVKGVLGGDPLSGALFVFRNRRASAIKVRRSRLLALTRAPLEGPLSPLASTQRPRRSRSRRPRGRRGRGAQPQTRLRRVDSPRSPSGTPRCPSSRSSRLKGSPLPYFKSPIMAAEVASHLASPTPCSGRLGARRRSP